MAVPDKNALYQPGPGEKSASVMVYTAAALCWGEIVVKEVIRVSTWLRTNTAPDHICLYNAKYMVLQGSAAKPISFPELLISTAQVLAFHIAPPAKDPLDFDPSEPNRKMEAVSALVGNFRVDGWLRMASITNLARYVEVTRENFTGLYDAEITNIQVPNLGVIKVPFLLLRQATTLFATRAVAA